MPIGMGALLACAGAFAGQAAAVQDAPEAEVGRLNREVNAATNARFAADMRRNAEAVEAYRLAQARYEAELDEVRRRQAIAERERAEWDKDRAAAEARSAEWVRLYGPEAVAAGVAARKAAAAARRRTTVEARITCRDEAVTGSRTSRERVCRDGRGNVVTAR